MPLIALCTGARLGEICQLDTTDIRTVDGVDCIVVSLRSLNGTTDKQLKTTASYRLRVLRWESLRTGSVPVRRLVLDQSLGRYWMTGAAKELERLADRRWITVPLR